MFLLSLLKPLNESFFNWNRWLFCVFCLKLFREMFPFVNIIDTFLHILNCFIFSTFTSTKISRSIRRFVNVITVMYWTFYLKCVNVKHNSKDLELRLQGAQKSKYYHNAYNRIQNICCRTKFTVIKLILPQFDLDMFMLANSKEATADDSLSCSFLKVWNFVTKFDVVLLRFSK